MMTRRNTYVCTERPGAERPSLLPNGKENRYEGRAAMGKERWGIGEQAPLSKMLDIMGGVVLGRGSLHVCRSFGRIYPCPPCPRPP